MPKDSLQKVVLHHRTGAITLGFAYQTDFGEDIKIITREGKEQTLPVYDLKAVFFVREFKGDPKYEEIKFLVKMPVSPTVWVRAQFSDGEILEGRVSNGLDLLTQPGFYLSPSDRETNNLRVFVVKSALASFAILSPDP
ncbi:MAG: hypothetical protein EHM61_10690 [Acidobacteria bacterium]|nr:MAG: hypothetical protein EHM61_10690 [Acidobacteriota bacterium]